MKYIHCTCCYELFLFLFSCYTYVFIYLVNSSTIVVSDVSEEMVEEHVWVGTSGGAGSLGQRCVLGSSLLLHHSRGVQEVTTVFTSVHLATWLNTHYTVQSVTA